jgi:hypothetical protein
MDCRFDETEEEVTGDEMRSVGVTAMAFLVVNALLIAVAFIIL